MIEVIVIFVLIFALITNDILHEEHSYLNGLILIFITVFSLGILSMLGLPRALVKLYRDVLILVQFFRIYNEKKKNHGYYDLIGENIIFAFIGISIFSMFYNYKSFLHLAVFMEDVLIFIIFFWNIYNLKLTNDEIEKLNKYIIALFLVQIPAAFIKFFVYRTFREHGGIGTFEVDAASLAAILPMLTTAYLISFYHYTEKRKYIIIIILFLAFGVINEKRGIIFLVPLIATINYLLFIYYERENISTELLISKIWSNIFLLITFFLLSFYFISRLIPSLNPEDAIWGRFDADYTIRYMREYSITDQDASIREMRRDVAPRYFYNNLKTKGYIHVLIGMGPGDIIQSRFLKDVGSNPILEKYGVRYAGRTAMLWFFIQLGILGTVVYAFFHIFLFLKIGTLYRNTKYKYARVLCLVAMSFVFVFFIDGIFYSNNMLKTGAMMLPYFYLTALILNPENKSYFKQKNKEFVDLIE